MRNEQNEKLKELLSGRDNIIEQMIADYRDTFDDNDLKVIKKFNKLKSNPRYSYRIDMLYLYTAVDLTLREIAELYEVSITLVQRSIIDIKKRLGVTSPNVYQK